MTTVAPVQLPSSTDRMVVSAELPQLNSTEAFAAFTTAELIVQWWPEEAEIDPRLNGAYRLLWPKMNWALAGRFTEFVPGQRLSYTWNWSHQPDLPERLVSIDFVPHVSGCLLTISQGKYGDSAVEQEDRQGHIDGWIYFLSRLQSI